MSSFDYVIVGAGNSGLALAARLAENKSISVCVLEAGNDLSGDVNTQIPGFLMKNWGNKEVDWMFKTVPQTHASNTEIGVPRGKGLGGTSNLNMMAIGRPPAHEYDAFERLGALGWNESQFSQYLKKSLGLGYSTEEIERWKVNPDPDLYGGPVTTTLPRHMPKYFPQLKEAYHELGLPYNPNPLGGDNLGLWAGVWAIDAEKTNRISAVKAYYEPVKGQANITIILEAIATRVIFDGDKTPDGLVTAKAVEYVKGGQSVTVAARKEVLLAAGSIKTPQLLELSGIGDKSVLDKHGISTLVELPGDHFSTYMVAELKEGFDSCDVLFIPERAAQEWALFEKERRGLLSTVPLTFSFLPLNKVDEDHTILKAAAAVEQGKIHAGSFHLLQEWLSDSAAPGTSQLEIIICDHFIPTATKPTPDPGKTYLGLSIIDPHPFARGTVHIASTDPLASPIIDYSALDNPVDVAVLANGLKFGRKILNSQALKSVVVKEVAPGPAVADQASLEDAVRKQIATAFHPVGTTAMFPRNENGVVDPELKVYGTANLRVVDASIIPIHFAAHPMATCYAIAEKAADIIKVANK